MRNVARNNTQALEAQNRVFKPLHAIRMHIWEANKALSLQLVSPTLDRPLAIKDQLEDARRKLGHLRDKSHKTQEYEIILDKLQINLRELQRKTSELLEKRHDINWVYPFLPFINEKLYNPNTQFETAANQALLEIAEEDGRPYASRLYGEFDQVLDLWRRKILNFRAVIIRYAGLNNLETAQETNLENLRDEIGKHLAQLEKHRQQDRLGFQSDAALEQMIAANSEWNRQWEQVKKLRNSNSWRVDVQFMQEQIIPLQDVIIRQLAALETQVQKLSKNTVVTTQNAAGLIRNILWVLSAIALFFVALVYFLIRGSVLLPIEQISSTLAVEGTETDFRLDTTNSFEINQLVDSFNDMRQQIHQRTLALEYQALHDGLTGLPNRTLLNDRINQAISIMKRTGGETAFLLLDLDRFKEVNDSLGHHIGDQLLQMVVKRLEQVLRESDTIARLGGDEFAIVAPNTALEQAEVFARKIIDAINEVFVINQQNLYVSASIGIAIYPQHGEELNDLVRHADIAMYHAKRNNYGYTVYEASLDKSSADTLALVAELRQELGNTAHLRMQYQPQINLRNREVVAVEALLHWKHPQFGLVPPEHIISVAEHTGNIGALTEWVINTSIRDMVEHQFPQQGIGLSLNLSAWNLQDPELVNTVDRALSQHGFPIELLTLEITETAMMNDPIRAKQVLHQLNDRGISIAIDDYGTGFSSLGYLKMLPVDYLKIDKSFVMEMLDNENDAIIVHSTIELAHNLGLKLIAEGVENRETLLRLHRLRCDVIQGYHIARPLPLSDLLLWLNEYQPRAAR